MGVAPPYSRLDCNCAELFQLLLWGQKLLQYRSELVAQGLN